MSKCNCTRTPPTVSGPGTVPPDAPASVPPYRQPDETTAGLYARLYAQQAADHCTGSGLTEETYA